MKHSMRKFAAALVLCVGLCLPMILPAGAVRVRCTANCGMGSERRGRKVAEVEPGVRLF